MIDLVEIVRKISRLAADQLGVFDRAELRAIISPSSDKSFYGIVRKLVTGGLLRRFSREIYVTTEFDPRALSQKLNPESYVSFANVLADELLIGPVPAHRVMAVKVGPTREYTDGSLMICHVGVKPHLFFGYHPGKGYLRADKEKAVLDTLYLHQKGWKFNFNVYSDVDYSKLDKKLVASRLGDLTT